MLTAIKKLWRLKGRMEPGEKISILSVARFLLFAATHRQLPNLCVAATPDNEIYTIWDSGPRERTSCVFHASGPLRLVIMASDTVCANRATMAR